MCAAVLCSVLEDSSAFPYVTLHPHCTERVRVIRVEDGGELVCRPMTAVCDTAELQQQLQDFYNSGMIQSASHEHACTVCHTRVIPDTGTKN